ncbi:Phosphate transporter PHO1-like protein 1 [Nymphaea thermarum]|nr:Phosphate transporter PHO1-like protein 1 [Nymphaea thermarum]
MVKFSKQFEAQLVPEWKDAFVDYRQLKKDLKKLQLLKLKRVEANHNQESEDGGKRSCCSSSSTFHRMPFLLKQYATRCFALVHRKLATSASKGDVYETELMEQFCDVEGAKGFFSMLDMQLNKVNQFYMDKEKEFLERGETLEKQMAILTELKDTLKQQRSKQGPASKEEDPSISSASFSLSCGFIEEEESLAEDPNMIDLEKNAASLSDWPQSAEELEKSNRFIKKEEKKLSLSRSFSAKTINCQGRNLRVEVPLTTPSRTLSALTYLLREDLMNQSKKYGPDGNKLNINKATLHQAEKMIRGALIELYKGLGYLKTYRTLNMMAFVKILKKFDKIKLIQTLVHQALKLADEVEEIFVKHFMDNDHRKAMKYLKPHQRKESHAVTFFIGLFTGCFIALFAGYAVMAHIAGLYTRQANSVYMETVYPVNSMFSLLFLHLFLYGCNIVTWKKARINYCFIFEFKPTKELKYRDVFLICTSCMTAVVAVMVAHLYVVAKGHSSTKVHAIPGLLLLVFLLLLVCPFNIVYRSSRFCFLRVMRNIVLTPLYKVVMVDFFMADQLCSQVPMLRSLEYVACYYITGSYRTQDYNVCTRSKHYRDLAYAVSFLPYYWRAMQCARRWFDEGQSNHLVNLGKYVSAMIAAGAKIAYERDRSVGWLSLLVITSSAATVYQLYWDFVKDWGLLQFNSRNPWLRNELMLRHKFIYYFSMVVNLVFRLAWLQTVLHSNFGSVDYRVTGFFLASLEVIRRGQWNFYRLENEHLNNAGKFRAVKTVPLPFQEVDED